MNRFYLIILFFIILPQFSKAQIGGKYTYNFLTLTSSAKVAGIGGKIVSSEANLSYAAQNPASLDSLNHNKVVLNYVNYYSNIGYGNFLFAQNKNKLGNFAAGIQFVNYGNFTRADIKGIQYGTFSASDYALNLIWSKKIARNLKVGVNIKPIFSFLENYKSYGLAADVGLYYNLEKHLWNFGLVFKNMGSQFKAYTSGNYEPLPFEIIMGASKKLAHAPFTFHITAHHLNEPDLSILNPTKTTTEYNSNNEPQTVIAKESFSEKLFSHFIFGVEFTPFKNFYLSTGYNYELRKNMKIEEKASTVGFSFGFGLRISRFKFSYGGTKYHLQGSSHHFSVSTTLFGSKLKLK